jgi:uncharacterized membrane protein
MHSLQVIIYSNANAERKARAKALTHRAEQAQRVIAERIARSRGIPVSHR